MSEKGLYEFEVSDPDSQAEATLTIRGNCTPRLLNAFLRWFQIKFQQMPTLMSPDEERELEKLKKINPNSLSQAQFERLRSLEEKTATDKGYSGPQPSDEESQNQPATEETTSQPETASRKPVVEKRTPSLDLGSLSPEDRALVGKNVNLMSQKEFERFRDLTETKKPRRRDGMRAGIFAQKRSGVIGK